MSKTPGQNTFVFIRSWGKAIRALKDDEAGQLAKALFDYMSGEDASEIQGKIPQCIFEVIKNDISNTCIRFGRVERP